MVELAIQAVKVFGGTALIGGEEKLCQFTIHQKVFAFMFRVVKAACRFRVGNGGARKPLAANWRALG